MIKFKWCYKDTSLIYNVENLENVEIYTIHLNNIFDIHHYTFSNKITIDKEIFYESIEDFSENYSNNEDINDNLCKLWHSRNDMEVD